MTMTLAEIQNEINERDERDEQLSRIVFTFSGKKVTKLDEILWYKQQYDARWGYGEYEKRFGPILP